MKIVSIFVPYLFAFQLPGEEENELKKVFSKWNNPKEITRFLNEHENDWRKLGFESLSQLRNELEANTEKFETILNEHSNEENPKLDQLFAPLNNSEYRSILLSKRKGKSSKRENYLRIYALKIDTNCYVITGGAIKFTHLMEERPHTQNELDKLELCRDFLNSKGIVDEDSFFDFLIEENDE